MYFLSKNVHMLEFIDFSLGMFLLNFVISVQEIYQNLSDFTLVSYGHDEKIESIILQCV